VRAPGLDRSLRVGIGGPVGSGKTTLVGSLCRLLRDELSMVVVTNDIFTSEDALALRRAAVLPADRIEAVETGCCPHTAIRDDIAANLDAVERMEVRHDPVDVTLVESGGDNLTAIFSRGLVDVQIFVIDTAGGDDIPRKGGPGVALADLLVINKVDLAPHVGSDVSLMLREAADRRHGQPVIPTSLVDADGARPVADWLREQLVRWRHRS
jgi:urease accessory protein